VDERDIESGSAWEASITESTGSKMRQPVHATDIVARF
jgi:hypothetical protein